MTEKQLENYIRGKYIGIVKGNYELYCPLRAGEINNFVQNVGKYADVEIIKLKGYEVLFDTHGQFINQIWPMLSESDRGTHDMMKVINQIANKLQEMRINDTLGEEPIRKVKCFMDEVLSQQMAENESMESLNESQHQITFQGHIF